MWPQQIYSKLFFTTCGFPKQNLDRGEHSFEATICRHRYTSAPTPHLTALVWKMMILCLLIHFGRIHVFNERRGA